MKRLIAAVALAAAFAAAGDVVSNVYTIVVNDGTIDSPVPIASSTVEIGSTAGGDTTSAAFGDVTFAPNSIFRKRGTGFVLSSLAMRTFTGEIRIEEGGFAVSTNFHMGVTNAASAPIVRVLPGATLSIDTPANLPIKVFKMYNPLYLAGEGVDGAGALAMRNRYSLQDQFFYGPWHLEGDALIVGYFNQRWDMSGSANVYMHGHNLYYRRASDAPGRSAMGPCGNKFYNTDPGAPPVTFTVDHEGFQLQGSPRFYGSPADRLIFTNVVDNIIYSLSAISEWTLVNATRTSFYPALAPFTYPNTDSGSYWNGPIVMDNGDFNFQATTTNQGFRLIGSISGTGNVYGQGNLAFLGTNTFTGTVGVNCTHPASRHGVIFKGAKAVPAGITDLAVTNASVAFGMHTGDAGSFLNGAVRLGRIAVHTTDARTLAAMEYCSQNNAVAGSVSNVVADSVVKTGAQKLQVKTPLTVTGDLDVREGSIAFACASAGIIGGRCFAYTPAEFYTPGGVRWTSDNLCAHDTTETWTNVVQLTPGVNVATYSDPLQYRWEGEQYNDASRVIVMYNGWIWNRSNENVTWTFAGSFGTHTTLWIDGAEKYWYVQYQSGKKANVTLTPGPHAIRISTYGKPNTGWGPNGSFTNMAWKVNDVGQGFRYDPQGRDSTSCADYVEFRDPGDGSLLTVSTNAVAAWRPEYSAGRLRVAKGAEVDLYGSAFDAGYLAGFGTITNSNPYVKGPLRVKDGIKVSAADANAATGPMKVHVPMSFAPGAKIVCENLADFPHSSEPIALVAADEPIEGLSNLSFDRTPGTPSRKWHIEPSPDGRSVRFAYACGTTMIFR